MKHERRRHVSNEVGKLRARIEKVRSQTERDYKKALKTVEKLKNKMNILERNISEKEQTETNEYLNSLESTIKRLNRFTDSQILRSKKAWGEYRKLEHDCKLYGQKPVQLDDLVIVCRKMEELAADLLCYSLARFKLAKQVT